MKTLIVSAAKTGHVNQCLAFTERAGWRVDGLVQIPSPGRMTPAFERLKLNVLRRLAAWRAAPRSRSPGPLRIVASGAASERVVAHYRALYGDDLFAVYSGRPTSAKPVFDLALVPRHSLRAHEEETDFAVAGARRAILRRGVPVRSSPPSAGDTRGALAMVGGVNKAYEIDPARIARQVQQLLAAGAHPFTVAFSRRTPAATEGRLRAALASEGVGFVDRNDRAGFERALASASEYVVTPDSLTMLCEACDTGKPVRVFDLACFDPAATTARCVQDLLAGGEIALAPGGVPTPPPPGRFRVSPAAIEVYREWEAGRAGV